MYHWVYRAVIVLLILTVIYAILRLLNRTYLKRKVMAEVVSLPVDEAGEAVDVEREYMVRFAARERKSRVRLMLWVYGFPVAVIAMLIYLAEYT